MTASLPPSSQSLLPLAVPGGLHMCQGKEQENANTDVMQAALHAAQQAAIQAAQQAAVHTAEQAAQQAARQAMHAVEHKQQVPQCSQLSLPSTLRPPAKGKEHSIGTSGTDMDLLQEVLSEVIQGLVEEEKVSNGPESSTFVYSRFMKA